MFPVLFQIGDVVVPTYLAIISIACSVCMIWTARRAEHLGLYRNLALDLAMVVMVAGFIGARAFHVVFEYPGLYREQPLRVFRVWEGGFVFYGGAILAVVAGVGFLKWKKKDLAPWLDLAAPVAALGYAIGRVGCFLAGCCYGRFCNLPWAVTFPKGSFAPVGMPLHPTQIYATLWEVGVIGILLLLDRQRHALQEGTIAKKGLIAKSGDLFFVWMMLHGLGRIVMEAFRADYRGRAVLGLSVSTTISILVIAVGAYFYITTPKGAKESSRA